MRDALDRLLKDLTHIGPHTGSGVAVRAASTILVSLTVLALVGQLNLAVYATFGAFASLYGTGVRHRGRIRIQAVVGAAFVATVTLGAVIACFPNRSLIAVPIMALVAVIAGVASDRAGLRPPGPLFFVFALSSCAAVPTDAHGVLRALLISAGSATIAVLAGVVETRLLGVQEAPPPAPARRTAVLACAAAVLIASGLATLAGVPYPYWAAIAATVPFSAPTPRAQAVRAIHRVVGTLVGLVLAAALLSLPDQAWLMVPIAAALQGCTELVVTRHYGMALVFITPLALVLMHLAHPQPLGQLLGARLVETVIGVMIGVVAALLAEPTVRRRLHARGQQLV